MSVPRQVEANKTYLLTRRTTGRFFLLRPDADGAMQNIFLFCMACVAALFGIEVHAFVLMSTHYHAVVTDTRGVLPRFLHRFHRLLAVCTQCHRGWGEAVFNKAQTSVVDLASAAVMIDKMAYVLANPVAAGAVRYARDWPGLRTRVEEIGSRLFTAVRPSVFFRSKTWAATVSLPVTFPAEVLQELGADEARRQLRDAVVRHEAEARAEVRARGGNFLGADRVMRTLITRRGVACEVWGSRNPTFATGTDRELFLLMVARRRAFRAAHRDALLRWRAGDRAVRFPSGTWKMRVLHNARVEPPPD